MNENPENDAFPELRKPPASIRLVGDMGPLFSAKAKARLAFKPIIKNRHVKVQTDRGPYEFDYATLDSVRDSCDSALAENGLDVSHVWCDGPAGWNELHSFLTHSSGAFIESVLSFQTVGTFSTKAGGTFERPLKYQEVGSLLTYWERYSYVAMIGVASEADDDGNAADGNQVTESRDRSKAPTPQAKPAPKAVPKVEPEARTQPKSDRPPPPVPSEAFDDSDEPCPEAISKEIGMIFRRLKMQPTETVVMCREVTGKAPKELTLADGEKLLAHVRKLEAAEKEAQAALPGNVG